MTDPSQRELILAVEKAIDSIQEQQLSIDRIDAGLSALSVKVQNIEKSVNSLDSVPQELEQIKTSLTDLTSRTSAIRNELDIVSLDTNAQHQTYEHGQDVLDDWRAEMEAGMIEPALTRTDIDHRSSEYNNRRSASGMHLIKSSSRLV